MQLTGTPITRMSEADDAQFKEEIIRLYEKGADLRELPKVLFASTARLIDADVVAYTEFCHRSGEFRSLISLDDDPSARARAMEAFARHMHSHPFWSFDAAFFGERALRESDFFSDEEFFSLPIAKEALLPSKAHRIMTIVIEHGQYVVSVSGHRVLNRPPFSDYHRDLFQAFRPHVLRSYRYAQQRTLSELTPSERLRLAFPDLSRRQLEVASWLAQGKSNDDIAAILDLSIDTIKAHIKAIYSKIGSESRLAAAIIAHTAHPFAQTPPLWKLDIGACGASKTPECRR